MSFQDDSGLQGKISQITTTPSTFSIKAITGNQGAEEDPLDAYANEDGNIVNSVGVESSIDETYSDRGITLDIIVPTKQDYTFQGWSLDGENVLNDPGDMKFYEPTTLLAVWQAD